MINNYKNYSLVKYNTFGIEINANRFIEFDNSEDIRSYLRNNSLPKTFFILGGGSNILFLNDFKGAILYPNIKGIKIISEDDKHIYVEVGAGENWDKFVEWTVNNNYSGLENLSLIPGNVGAVPVQNIGAYGVEAKDYIVKVKGINVQIIKNIELKGEDCNFGYRDSIFKNKLKDKVIIEKVTFKLNKNHSFKLEYGLINSELKKFDEVNLQNIRQVILNIRNSKLPDPKEIGNGGSFFKNPIVSLDKLNELKAKYPDIPQYPQNEMVKLAAGWLIDKCGWKGKSYKNAAVHKKQALVLINNGNATGQDILELSMKIEKSVLDKFGVILEREVIVI